MDGIILPVQPFDSICSILGLLVARLQVYLKVYLFNLFPFLFSLFHKFSLIYRVLRKFEDIAIFLITSQ